MVYAYFTNCKTHPLLKLKHYLVNNVQWVKCLLLLYFEAKRIVQNETVQALKIKYAF